MIYLAQHKPERDNFFYDKWIELNGKELPTLEALYKYLSIHLPLPDYFGNNLDALDECLNDLSFLEEVEIIFEFTNWDNFLNEEEEAKDTKLILLQIFIDAAQNTNPIETALEDSEISDGKMLTLIIPDNKQIKSYLKHQAIDYNQM
jgi:RNAse (barnase) inhibitor barstar